MIKDAKLRVSHFVAPTLMDRTEGRRFTLLRRRSGTKPVTGGDPWG